VGTECRANVRWVLKEFGMLERIVGHQTLAGWIEQFFFHHAQKFQE
jgi:hypothetical protein